MNGRSPKRSTSIPATGATTNSVAVHGSSRTHGAQRSVAQPGLEELGEEEHGPEQPGEGQEHRAVPGRERPRAEEAHGQHGLAGPQLPGHEGDGQHHPARQGAQHLGAGPAGDVAPHQAPHDAQRPAGAQREAPQVEGGIGAVGLVHAGQDQRDGDQAQRHVDPEDPLPGQSLGDGAAHQRAAGRGHAHHALQDADGGAPPLGREGGAHQGQRQRQDRRGARPLHRAGRDQLTHRAGQAAGRGGGHEQPRPHANRRRRRTGRPARR